MSSTRSLPIQWFTFPEVMELERAEHRLILLSLLLAADDEGRGFAHPTVLACESGLFFSSEVIEEALHELEANELVQCYQYAGQGYYQLTHWSGWQKVRNPSPSCYPAPPAI